MTHDPAASGESVRYEALARALLASPTPVRAIASELGDQAGRLDALCRRLDHVEATLAERKSHG